MIARKDRKEEIDNLSRRTFLYQALGLGCGAVAGYAAGAAAASAPSQPGPAAPVLSTAPHPAVSSSGSAPHPRGAGVPHGRQRVEARVHVNQVGYLPDEPKRAVIPATGPIVGNSFTVLEDDITPRICFRGELAEFPSPAPSGHFQRHFLAQFDPFRRPGRYRLRLSDGRLSPPFSIGRDLYARLVPLALSYFHVQRCGHQPPSEIRGPCHVDDGIAVGGPRDGQPIDASGGWHDAGDYLKFVETTSYVIAMMLFAYEHCHRAFAGPVALSSRLRHPPGSAADVGHPAPSRRPALPPLLGHARVGLDWLLKMHPSPEEFYYQVGDESDHNTWRLPEEDCPRCNPRWMRRPVYFGVGANLAGRTAVALSMASRLFARYDPPYAARCLAAAQSAFELGLKHQRVLTTRPSDFYPERTWADDMEWAAIDLYQSTGRPEYLEQALAFSQAAGSANDQTSVYNTHALAHSTLYPFAPPRDRERLLDYLRADAELIRKCAQNPYGLGTPYVWGTAEAAAGAAITSLIYAALSRETEYLDVARRQRDFVLGCNPFGLSCVIGAGSRYPLFPHHQIANIRSIELSGALVGGPTSNSVFKKQRIGLDDVEFSAQNPGPLTAEELPDEVEVYHDAVQDYVTNEPADDYTVKFLLLTAFYGCPAGSR